MSSLSEQEPKPYLTADEHNEYGDNAGRFSYYQWVYDESAVEAIVAARVAAAREEAAAMVEALPAEMDAAWGGDAAWLTTGTKVAALVSDWLDELAADIRKGADRG